MKLARFFLVPALAISLAGCGDEGSVSAYCDLDLSGVFSSFDPKDTAKNNAVRKRFERILRESSPTVPSEIRDAYDTQTEGILLYYEKLAAVGFDRTKLKEADLTILDRSPYAEAIHRTAAWREANCPKEG